MKLEGYGAVVMADAAGVKKPPNMSDEVTFLVQVVPLWLPIYALVLAALCQTNLLQNIPLTIIPLPLFELKIVAYSLSYSKLVVPMYLHSSLVDVTKYLKSSQLKHGLWRKRLDEGDTKPVLLAHYRGQPLVYSRGCIQEQKTFQNGRSKIIENVDNDAPSIPLVPQDCIYADVGC